MNNGDIIEELLSTDHLFEKQRRKEMLVRYDFPMDLAHFIILHAHNTERFGEEFSSLTYNNLVSGSLTKMQRACVEEVVKDLQECLDNEAKRLLSMSVEEEKWNRRAVR
jgi:hypothetical protein